jgi:hypothetical protein
MHLPEISHHYGNRFVAFVDILGFKQMISQIENQTQGHVRLFQRLRSVLNFLNEESVESNGQHDLLVYELSADKMIERELGDPRITYVSDCAIVSTEGTFDGFKSLCNKLTKISTDLACDGMFVRGAITYGPLYHDKKFVFGSAYQRAYEVESTIADTPRIIIDDSALTFLKDFDGQFPLRDSGVRIDSDGFRYLRPFPFEYYPAYAFNWLGFLLRVKGHILFSLNMYDGRVDHFSKPLVELDKYYQWREFVGERPDFAGANEKVMRKYLWLKDEFNRTISQYAELLTSKAGKLQLAPILDLGTHWGPEHMLGHYR